MRILKLILLAFSSMAFGATVAGGYFALISMLGIVPRLSSISKTADHISSYENALIYGACVGCLFYSHPISLWPGEIILAVISLFGGIFIGCLAGALAEVVNVIPIFMRRTNLRKGIPYMIYALGIGKVVGVLVQFFVFR